MGARESKKSNRIRFSFGLLKPLIPLLLLSSCNIFSPVSSPSGNVQILSAARAAFNQGDMETALEYYAALTDDYADRGIAESAFVTLNQNNATMTDFVTAILQNPMQGLTVMASSISTAGTSEAKRVALFNAYVKAGTITEPNLKAFVRFLTSFALTAELLAEEAGGDELIQADLVDDVTACRAAEGVAACTEAGCTKSNPGLDVGTAIGADGLDEDGLTADGTKGTLTLLFAATQAMGSALGALTGSGGDLASGSAQFSEALEEADALGVSCSEQAYRNALLLQKIGE